MVLGYSERRWRGRRRRTLHDRVVDESAHTRHRPRIRTAQGQALRRKNMNTATTTLTPTPGFFSSRGWFDWLFAAIVIAGGAYAFASYSPYMDVYEKGILVG